MRGIERTFGVSCRTLSACLKEQANDLPVIAKRFLCWRGRSYGPLSFVAKTKFGSGLPWIERPEKSSPLPAVSAAKTPVEYSGIAYRLLIKKPSFSVLIGARTKPSLRASNIALWVKKRGKRLIVSVGTIPYANSWHASYVRRCLFPTVLECMRFS